LIKNSQPFGKKFQKTVGGGDFFWLTLYIHIHITYWGTSWTGYR